jgi:hypothetical protein
MLPNPEWERAHAATRSPESGSVFQAETYWRDRAAALEAELAAVKRDAERYHVLRDFDEWPDSIELFDELSLHGVIVGLNLKTGEDLDAACDAAVAALSTGGGEGGGE